MSADQDGCDVIVDNEETQALPGSKVKIVASSKGEDLVRLVDAIKAEGPAYQVRHVERLRGPRGKRSRVDLLKLPPDHQD